MNWALHCITQFRTSAVLSAALLLSACGGSSSGGDSENSIVGSEEIENVTPLVMDSNVSNYPYATITERNVENVVKDASRILGFNLVSNLGRIYELGGAIYTDSSLSNFSSTAFFCEVRGQFTLSYFAPSKLVNSEGRLAAAGESVIIDYQNCTYRFSDTLTISLSGGVNTTVVEGYHDGFDPLVSGTNSVEDFDDFSVIDSSSNFLEYIDGSISSVVTTSAAEVTLEDITWVIDLNAYDLSYSADLIELTVEDGVDSFGYATHTMGFDVPVVINSEVAGMKYRIEIINDIILSESAGGLAAGTFLITSSSGQVSVRFRGPYLEYSLDANNDGFYETGDIIISRDYF